MAFPVLPDDARVLFFARDRRDFGFLPNFHPSRIRLGGQDWPHVEAYYQAQKSLNPAYREEALRKTSPSWAKHVGDSRVGDQRISRNSWFRAHPEDLRGDWELVKVEIMRTALQAKFTQHRGLQLSLLNTWPAELIEDSARDAFWGAGADGLEKNLLGRLLMEQRNQLRAAIENQ